MTTKQYDYLRTTLIPGHPNFKKEVKFDGIHTDENRVSYYFLLTGEGYPHDKEYIGTVDEVQAAWVTAKYGKYLQNPITSLWDLNTEESSGLITHLLAKKK